MKHFIFFLTFFQTPSIKRGLFCQTLAFNLIPFWIYLKLLRIFFPVFFPYLNISSFKYNFFVEFFLLMLHCLHVHVFIVNDSWSYWIYALDKTLTALYQTLFQMVGFFYIENIHRCRSSKKLSCLLLSYTKKR